MNVRRRGARRRCPVCDGSVVNVQGLADCPDCRWTAGASGDR